MSETIKKQGGIQFGGSATTPLASKVDKRTKTAFEIVSEKHNGTNGIIADKSMSKKFMKENGFKKKMNPDGGMWWVNGYLRMVVEAKTQGNKGNAIERHADNYKTAMSINKKVIYITLGEGLGFNEGEVCHNFGLRQMEIEAREELDIPAIQRDEEGKSYRHKEFNILYESGQSWFKSEDFTVEDICNVMEQALLKIINEDK